METLIYFLDFAIRNRFLFLTAALLFLLALRFVLSFIIKSKPKKTAITLIVAFCIWGAVLFFFFGTSFVNQQIYDYGKKGEAVMVNSKNTGNLYNEEPIIRHEILIKAENGEMIETSFESNDFILYPKPEENSIYPSNGITFNVRYLKKNPNVFVIVTDDTSNYAKKNFCAEKRKALNVAKNKFDFDAQNNTFKNLYLKAIEAYLQSNCVENSAVKDFYIQEMSKLE